ncbi:hypothetical protein L7F22_040669 [Adiantum nelumboides]|nr:hypothetical protein [Adiantum nelumboides]
MEQGGSKHDTAAGRRFSFSVLENLGRIQLERDSSVVSSGQGSAGTNRNAGSIALSACPQQSALMAPSDKKSEAAKAPAKVEAISLKVFIHCEGCKKKVKKTLQQIDGVETVHIDAGLGKVIVTATVDAKVLIKKLEKVGKVAEVLVAPTATSGTKGKEQPSDHSQGEKKAVKKVRFQEGSKGDKVGKGGGNNNPIVQGDRTGSSSNGTRKDSDNIVGGASKEENGKNKRVEDGGFNDVRSSKNVVYKNITPMMIETGYSLESADYATHIFSDENTESCHIM